jgi:hypothetical protein
MKNAILILSAAICGSIFSSCNKEVVTPTTGNQGIQPAPYKVVFVSGKEIATSKLYLDGRNIQYLTARETTGKPLDETTRSLQVHTYVIRMFDANGREELVGRLHFTGQGLEKDMELGDVRIERDDLDRLYTVWLDM